VNTALSPTPNSRQPLIVGVTGGIGSGKSVVCGMLESFGRTVLSADQLARELMTQKPFLRRRIAAAFGSDIYDAHGALNRSLLAQRAFSSRQRTSQLNAIVHPAVLRALREQIRRLSLRKRSPYLVVEAALVFESGLDTFLDLVVVVDAPRELRLQRVMRRDGSSRPDVLRRMRAQLPSKILRERADVVLMNTHDTFQLRAKVAFLDAFLRELAAR